MVFNPYAEGVRLLAVGRVELHDVWFLVQVIFSTEGQYYRHFVRSRPRCYALNLDGVNRTDDSAVAQAVHASLAAFRVKDTQAVTSVLFL